MTRGGGHPPAPAAPDDGAPGDDLHELGHRPTPSRYLRDIWDRRGFAVGVPLNDIRVQHIDTALGQVWQLLNPALTVAVYFLVFGVLLDGRVNRGVDNYLGFLVVGIMLHGLLSKVLVDGVRLMRGNEGLIRSVQFPRAILPISNVVLHLLAFAPSALVTVVTMLLTGETPRLRWLLFPPLVVAFCVFLLGVSFVAARAGDSVRDLGNVVPHVTRVLFYLSGILFAVDAFVTDPDVARLFSLNPLYDYVQVARWSLMDGRPVDAADVVGLVAWTVVAPIGGLVVFARAEHRYGA